MLLTCLGATDYGDANAEATNEKEALDFNEFSKVLIFFPCPNIVMIIVIYQFWVHVLALNTST